MAAVSPWVNTSIEHELAWHEQKVAALQAHRQALIDVMALRDREARRRFLDAYRKRWGVLSAEGLEMRVRQAFLAKFGDSNV